jgi:glutamate-1-semialdehyde aminotransferase
MDGNMTRWAFCQRMDFPADGDGNRILFERGEGSYLFDSAGTRYIDFCNGFGAVTLGYNDPDVEAVIRRSLLSRSNSLQVPTKHLVELSEVLLEDFPRYDTIALLPGGTSALRTAAVMVRRLTRRQLIVSAGYHGWDPMWAMGTEPFVPNDEGVIDFFFILEKLSEILEQRHREIAALFLSPDHSYFSTDYYRRLGAMCAHYGILTVVDDVKCGYRYRIGPSLDDDLLRADIIVVAKGIGNGSRIAAIVGRSKMLEHIQDVCFTSFYDVLPAIVATCTLRKVKAHDVPAAIRRVGDRFIAGAREHIAAAGLPIIITGNGNLFQFVPGTPSLGEAFYHAAAQHRMLFFRNDNQCPSFAFTDAVCMEALERFEGVLDDLKSLSLADLGAGVRADQILATAANQCDGCMEAATLDSKLAWVREQFEAATARRSATTPGHAPGRKEG